jgi:hypothetical protein
LSAAFVAVQSNQPEALTLLLAHPNVDIHQRNDVSFLSYIHSSTSDLA